LTGNTPIIRLQQAAGASKMKLFNYLVTNRFNASHEARTELV
jgi:hypothetical protein